MLRLASGDPASAGDHHVQDKPVFVKRKRAAEESSSSEEDEEEEEEEAEDAAGEEEEEEAVAVQQPARKKKKKSSESRGDVVAGGSQKKAPKRSGRGAKSDGEPIYEDYLTESDLESTLERLLQSHFAKAQSKAEPPPPPPPPPPPKKKSESRKPVAAAPRESADRRALLQLSKSFESLQKKLSKVLSS
jgi:hypothetical protein